MERLARLPVWSGAHILQQFSVLSNTFAQICFGGLGSWPGVLQEDRVTRLPANNGKQRGGGGKVRLFFQMEVKFSRERRGQSPCPLPSPELSYWKSKANSDRKSTRLNSSHRWISYAVF